MSRNPRVSLQETTLNPYGYTGREIETDELYYYRARYYDAQMQRFISVDPIELESQDFNWYRYVGNSPVNLVDPYGLDWLENLSDLWDAGLYDSWKAKKAAEKAFELARKSKLPGVHNGKQDAFRHCVWSCLMAQSIPKEDAKEIGDNHESAGDRVHNQPACEKSMDLHNNKVGRNLAFNKKGKKQDCAKKCMSKLKSGGLIYGVSGKAINYEYY
jgi:RHS repeat-associated protein